MLLRGRALGQRDRLPFANEILRGHQGGGPRRTDPPLSMSRRRRGAPAFPSHCDQAPAANRPAGAKAILSASGNDAPRR